MSIVRDIKEFNIECQIIYDKYVILKKNGELPSFDDLKKISSSCETGEQFLEAENNICALELKSLDRLDDGFTPMYIREFFALHKDEMDVIFKLSRAKVLIHYLKTNRFCGACAASLDDMKDVTGKVCPNCGRVYFPRIEPCVILRVMKDNKLLLAKHLNRNTDMYASIAGFVEAGETLENACAREVFEETGIRIKNIHYLSSQSWPFPDQLMLAFEAEYESGDIKVQKEELTEAEWFAVDELPNVPAPGSISHDLIHFNI